MKVRGHVLDFDVREELEQYGEFSGSKVKWGRDRVQAPSPFRYDEHPSFFVRLVRDERRDYDKGIWVDSGADSDDMKSGNFVSLIQHLRQITYEEACDYLIQMYSTGLGYESVLELRLPEFEMSKTRKKYLPESVLSKYEQDGDYLGKRGIHKDIQKIFDIKYDKKSNLVVIPWYDSNGKLAAVKYRRTDTKIFFYHKDATPIQELVYGMQVVYQKQVNEVAIVEAELDALTLWSNGVPAVAIGGSAVSDKKIEILTKSPIESVIILTDRDTVGENIRKELETKLPSFMRIKHAHIPQGYKDANDLAFEPHLLKSIIQSAIEKEIKFF